MTDSLIWLPNGGCLLRIWINEIIKVHIQILTPIIIWKSFLCRNWRYYELSDTTSHNINSTISSQQNEWWAMAITAEASEPAVYHATDPQTVVKSKALDDQNVFSFQMLHRLTSSSSLGLVCSILLKVVSPAFTMAVDKVWPETHSNI